MPPKSSVTIIDDMASKLNFEASSAAAAAFNTAELNIFFIPIHRMKFID